MIRLPECTPDGTVIGENAKDDAKRFENSENGIVLVTPEMLGQMDFRK